MQEHPETPVPKRIAEEEKVATTKTGDERDRHEAGNLPLREIVDVIVLGDDEAVPLALGLAIHLSVNLEDDGLFLQ